MFKTLQERNWRIRLSSRLALLPPPEKNDHSYSTTRLRPSTMRSFSTIWCIHSFLSDSRPNPNSQTQQLPADDEDKALQAAIAKTYGSKEYLISSMSAAAQGIFGSGWIWLVADCQSNLGIIATYGAGTLLARSRASLAPPLFAETLVEPKVPSSLPSSHNEQPLLSPTGEVQKRAFNAHNIPGSEHARLLDSIDLHSGEYLYPMFCISVNEHAWLSSGYGIWGKKEYLRQFWTSLDWNKVAKNYAHWTVYTRPTSS
jgi:Fe-Mn family superoxide dismutase